MPAVRPAVLGKGFRPFFWLAAVHVALVLPAWLLALSGRWSTDAYLSGTFWHAHEMLFGFTLAVIAGFLLTAVGNWTERETAVGLPLALMAVLWVLGRLSVTFADALPRGMAAVVDLSFVPALGVACARPVLGTRNARNYPFLVMLGVLFVANLGMHLGALGIAPAALRKGAWLGIYAVVLMMLVMTGRIVPMFTRNATRAEGILSVPRLDRAAVGSTLVAAAADLTGLDERAVAALSVLAAVSIIARAWRWGARHTHRQPLLWVLHAGHAFIAMGFLLRAVGLFVPRVTPAVSLHAFTAGGIGLLTLGMMARVSLGHTGRMLAPRPSMSAGFLLVLVAAVVRVFGPLLGPDAYLPTMIGSGTLFALGFAIFLVVYTPILLAPRVDGKPG